MRPLDSAIAPPIGSALVTNTMIGEASRFLTRDFSRQDIQDPPDDYRYASWAENYATPLIDLCSLIDAVVLHDQLYILPCQMKSETKDLELRTSLVGPATVRTRC